jgi:hypothetical protein
MDFVRVLSCIFLLIGLVMLGLAGRRVAMRRAFIRNSVTAVGEVIALIEVPEGAEVTNYQKVLFRTQSGREVTFRSEMGHADTPRRRVGEKVTVRYLPNQPDTAEIESFLSLWGAALVFGILGSVFTFVGLGILVGFLPV